MQIDLDFEMKIDITEKVKEEINTALWGVGLDCKRECQAGTPVSPIAGGHLRSSYSVEVKNGEATITNSANYAAYVEFGDLRGAKPRGEGKIPFMRPALYANIDNYLKTFGQIVKDNM